MEAETYAAPVVVEIDISELENVLESTRLVCTNGYFNGNVHCYMSYCTSATSYPSMPAACGIGSNYCGNYQNGPYST